MVDSICLSRFYLNMTKIGKEKKNWEKSYQFVIVFPNKNDLLLIIKLKEKKREEYTKIERH